MMQQAALLGGGLRGPFLLKKELSFSGSGAAFPSRHHGVSSSAIRILPSTRAAGARSWKSRTLPHDGAERVDQSTAFGLGGEVGLMAHSLNQRRAPLTRPRATEGGDVEKLVGEKVPAVKAEIGKSLYFSVAVASLGAVLFGYHLGVINGALDYLSNDIGIAGKTAIQACDLFVFFCPVILEVLERSAGWVVSITLVGATLGSFTGGTVADKLGRTKSFQLAAIPLIIGPLLSATATDVRAMLAGRFLAGLGIGVSSALVPLFIAEISPTEIRGSLGSVNQISICIGILLALIAGLPLSGNPVWWKTMFLLAVAPAVLLVVGMFYAPESPRWLYQQGRKAEAENAIVRLWGEGKLKEAVLDLDQGSNSSAEETTGWGDLFGARYFKVVSVGAILFLLQQFAGINAVVYYSTAVFRSAGIKSDVAASALVGAANVFGSLVASSLMDNQGRKKLLIGSFLGMAVSMSVLALALAWPAVAAYAGTLAVAGTVSYVLAFSLGAGPVPGLILPEIFPSKIRAKAVALAMGVHWITNFLVGLYFLPIVTKYGVSSVYVAFATVCLLGVLYVRSNVMETKGKSLEEIERVLIPAAA